MIHAHQVFLGEAALFILLWEIECDKGDCLAYGEGSGQPSGRPDRVSSLSTVGTVW